MNSTSFRIKKPCPDRQNHQNCLKTLKINQNRSKYFPEIINSDPRLKNSTLCMAKEHALWHRTSYTDVQRLIDGAIRARGSTGGSPWASRGVWASQVTNAQLHWMNMNTETESSCESSCDQNERQDDSVKAQDGILSSHGCLQVC